MDQSEGISSGDMEPDENNFNILIHILPVSNIYFCVLVLSKQSMTSLFTPFKYCAEAGVNYF